MARRKRSGKKASRRRKSTRKRTVVIHANPRRRARRSHNVKRSRRRRSYRRNPGLGGFLPTTGFLMDAVYVTGGFIGTKIAANFVLPMVGIQQPALRIVAKGILAGAVGYAGKMLLGKSAGQFLMVGGLVEAVNDAVQTYVAPMVPQLSVSAYPELGYNGYDMGAYPELSGMVDSDVMETI